MCIASHRQTEPRRRSAAGGELENIELSALPSQLDEELRKAGRLAAVVSPHLTVEEAWLLCSYIRSVDAEAPLVCGPVVRRGEDESYPNGLTISAEKAPNRRGVEEVVAHFGGQNCWDGLLQRDDLSELGVWVSGGYKADWHDEEASRRLREARLLVVHDLFDSPLWRAADYQIPGAAFAEREGAYVNRNDLLQAFQWAVRPPAGATVDGWLLWRLSGRRGMYRAAPLLQEIARQSRYFAAAAGVVPPTGVDLKSAVLAKGGTSGEVTA